MLQETFQEYSSKLIGLPYEDYDCYDVVRHFYKMVFDINIHEYQYPDPNDSKHISGVVELGTKDFEKVSCPKFGDIVLLRLFELPAHVGIYIDDKTILHTKKNTGSIIDRSDNIQRRVLGYYRYGKSKD